jgi:hypothetical protein
VGDGLATAIASGGTGVAQNAPSFEALRYRTLSPDLSFVDLRARSGLAGCLTRKLDEYRGCPRAPVQSFVESIVALGERTSDRQRQLPSYRLSATIFSRLLTRSNETELQFPVRARTIALEDKEKRGAPGTIRTCDVCLRRAAVRIADDLLITAYVRAAFISGGQAQRVAKALRKSIRFPARHAQASTTIT